MEEERENVNYIFKYMSVEDFVNKSIYQFAIIGFL